MNRSQECGRKAPHTAIHDNDVASTVPPKRLLVRRAYYIYMSEAATNDDGEDDIATVNFKVTESFLERIDDMWQGRGFNSRSEFIRYTLRDAVEFPTFDRDELVALLEAEEDIREGRTTSAEEARERFGTSDE